MQVDDYKNATPKLDLFEFFAGKTQAWGQFQDRSGKVLRRFVVDIDGKVDQASNTLTLNEDFIYNDGEEQTRVWRITKHEKTSVGTRYTGTAGDVIGKAQGMASGNALNWQYTLDLPYKDGTIHVKFDDWMYLHDDQTMLNHAEVSKFGFKVGEVTLFFRKPAPTQ